VCECVRASVYVLCVCVVCVRARVVCACVCMRSARVVCVCARVLCACVFVLRVRVRACVLLFLNGRHIVYH
jgi:hypothetical protein